MQPKPNSYTIGDAVEFARSLKGRVAGIVTSPPYNKTQKRKKVHPSDNWKANKLFAENYADYDDNLPEDKFVAWQREFVAECVETIGDDGVLLYNMGRRILNKRESLRYEIVQGFPVRQTIIWNRGSTNNQGGKRPTILPPIYELIYVIAGDDWVLPEKYVKEMRFWGDVWKLLPARNNPHPAPFPVDLAKRMCMLVDGPVADPFGGSGTTGIAAIELGLDYYLNDLSVEYKEMFEERTRELQTKLGQANQTVLFDEE